jgi:hypothetical protein
MRAGLSFSRSSISLLLRQPLSIKKSYAGAIHIVKGQKELAHTTVRLQLILFSKITDAYLFRIFGGFLHVPTTQI